MNDYIKRADALKLFAGGGKYPEGSFQQRLGKLGERLVMQIPFANVVEGDEYDRVRQALARMWYAYVNKDGECPHDFEARAVEMAEEVLGKWEDCMPQLMRDEGAVDRYAKLLREWEKVSKECAQDAQIAPVNFDWCEMWVKAADAMPPEDIEVLVACSTASEGRYQCIAYCYEDGEQTEYYYVDPEWHKGTRTWEEIRPAVRIKDTVTHWMRLPTFPKRLPND